MGGVDKGWVEYQGVPLIEHVILRLTPQTEQILIIANRSIDRYQQLGQPVVQDHITGFQGPLAGIHAALNTITTPLALVVPTDAPLLPIDLLALLAAKTHIDATLDHPVLTHDGEREQPLFGIYPKHLESALAQYLAKGERRLMQWCRDHQAEWIDLSTHKQAFANMNTPAQLVSNADSNSKVDSEARSKGEPGN